MAALKVAVCSPRRAVASAVIGQSFDADWEQLFANSTVSETSKIWSFLKNLKLNYFEIRHFYGTRLQCYVHKVQCQLYPVHNLTTK